MKTASAKNKGRRLQKEVVAAILSAFPELQPDDVRSTSMGNSGVDVQLSPAAQLCFPWAVECKCQEKLKGIYDMWAQASANATDRLSPLLVIRMNGQPPLAILDLREFLDLNAS